jgi:hypothetical protein
MVGKYCEVQQMIYKMLVNAAFLAIGYYIGKEVSRSELARTKPDITAKSPEKVSDNKTSTNTPKGSSS